jgi:NADPH:quinone reductase-like Zn-dependent oxidoreductase
MEQIMRKIVVEKPGGYDQLKLKETSVPSIGENEVLIECRACGVNFADCCVRMGVYRSAKEFVGWPITPGFEVSGTIKKIGNQVSGFTLGQRVIALTLFGGYCSHLAVSAKQVFPLPDFLSFEEGAGFPAIFLTGSYGLLELARAKKGNKILVHSAAGGVGSALVQLGKLAGCFVVGVVGASHKVEEVKKLGADEVIDKSTQNLWNQAERISPSGYEVILDANGPETLKQSYKHLSLGGKLIIYGFHTMLTKGKGKPNWLKIIWNYITTPRFNPMNMTNENRSIMAFNLSYLFNKESLLEGMDRLLNWVEQGALRLPKISSFPLENVAQAHKALESGTTTGKLILII